MADVAMPRLSDSMEEGTILKWLKSDGDEVSRGDEIVEIETDKANMTYEADQDGTLKIVAQEGDTLAVGETIARIGEGGETNGAAPAERESEEGGDEGGGEAETATATAEQEAPPEEPAEPQEREEEPAPAADGGNGRIKASPVARRMARELGLELGGLQGTGPGGRIVKADVEAASRGDGAQAAAAPAEAPAAEPEPEEERKAPPAVVSGDAQTGKGETTTQDLSRLQQTVARRMAESKATAPDFVLNIDVDMEDAVDLRKRLKAAAAEGQPVPSFNDFVVKAAARRSPARTRSSCRRCSTPTPSRSARSPARRARSPSASARARSRRRSCRRARSPSPTSACSASRASSR
jgi:pyruvate dehydrogenase E2 component (dihydrolipoyllysine-residue acetyltransferase)